MIRVLSHFTILLFLLLACVCVPFCAADGTGDGWSVSHGSRAEQIDFWEGELRKFRAGSLAEALGRLYDAQQAVEMARRREGWIYTSKDDKARIQILDEEYKRNAAEVAVLQRQEQMIIARVKPLYGIVSRYFAAEQRETIISSLKTMQKISYDSAWYDSLFNMNRAETFTDLIVGFLIQWLMGYIFLYPFAVLYYAFWTAPWSIYAFSSGTSDIFLGAAAWCLSVTLMCLPIIALVGCFFYINRRYGQNFAEAFSAASARGRRTRRYT